MHAEFKPTRNSVPAREEWTIMTKGAEEKPKKKARRRVRDRASIKCCHPY